MQSLPLSEDGVANGQANGAYKRQGNWETTSDVLLASETEAALLDLIQAGLPASRHIFDAELSCI